MYRQSNGDCYEGEYHLDRKHGFGKFTSAEGVYEVSRARARDRQ